MYKMHRDNAELLPIHHKYILYINELNEPWPDYGRLSSRSVPHLSNRDLGVQIDIYYVMQILYNFKVRSVILVKGW